MVGDRHLVGDELDSLDRGSTATAGEPHGNTVDEQLAAPHAVGLASFERTLQARRAQRAGAADPLGAGDVDVLVAEEEVTQGSGAIRAPSVADRQRFEADRRVEGRRFEKHEVNVRIVRLMTIAQPPVGHYSSFDDRPHLVTVGALVSPAMSRLCERPGCSDPASVAYGMRAEDLVFWLAAIVNSNEISGGVLCRRHADSMVVPRGWTLDDLRDPELHLFRPPAEQQRTGRSRRRRTTSSERDAVQLRLGVATDGSADQAIDPDAPVADGDEATPDDEVAATTAEPGEPWMPSFDANDDLDGLLSARSPLLSRAFRGDDRAR